MLHLLVKAVQTIVLSGNLIKNMINVTNSFRYDDIQCLNRYGLKVALVKNLYTIMVFILHSASMYLINHSSNVP